MNPKKIITPTLLITKNDWELAHKEFQPNCGPTALAAMTGLKLMDVCPLIPKFKERHYTNPTMMAAALKALGVPFTERDDSECDGHTLTRYGLVRIQWDGPWTASNANPRWAYRETHWIGAAQFDPKILGYTDCLEKTAVLPPIEFVFDINCGWQTRRDWEFIHVPKIIKECCNHRATGKWWATHRWELFQP